MAMSLGVVKLEKSSELKKVEKDKVKWEKSEPALKWIFRVSRLSLGLIEKPEDYSRGNMNNSVKKNNSVGLQIDAPSASPSPIPPDRLDYDIDITNLPQWVYWPRRINCSLFESQLISINIPHFHLSTNIQLGRWAWTRKNIYWRWSEATLQMSEGLEKKCSSFFHLFRNCPAHFIFSLTFCRKIEWDISAMNIFSLPSLGFCKKLYETRPSTSTASIRSVVARSPSPYMARISRWWNFWLLWELRRVTLCLRRSIKSSLKPLNCCLSMRSLFGRKAILM